MNHKFFIGAGLLLGLLCFCIAIGAGIRRIQDPVSREVERAIFQAESGKLSLAEESIRDAKSKWNVSRDKLAAFSDHAPIDHIDILLDRLTVRSKHGTVSEFLADCRELQNLLSSVLQEHTLQWWNLLCAV